eukprot:3183396-Pyramimonas_sp.AAC.1
MRRARVERARNETSERNGEIQNETNGDTARQTETTETTVRHAIGSTTETQQRQMRQSETK